MPLPPHSVVVQLVPVKRIVIVWHLAALLIVAAAAAAAISVAIPLNRFLCSVLLKHCLKPLLVPKMILTMTKGK